WNATSLAVPEYVMDFRSPSAFCALAITVFASCALAVAHGNVRQIAITERVFDTASPPYGKASSTCTKKAPTQQLERGHFSSHPPSHSPKSEPACEKVCFCFCA